MTTFSRLIASYRTAVLVALGLFIVSVAVHAMAARSFYQIRHAQTYEGPGQTLEGDFSYYLDGANSLYQLDPVSKFNDKREPILRKARAITANDFPSWAKYALILYPYPSFKFGYSLLVTAVTWPVADDFFRHQLPRLAFANLIINGLLAAFVYLTVLFLSRRHWVGVVSAVIVLLDYSNIHNSYIYMSHTSSGLMLVFAAAALFAAPGQPTPWRLSLGAFLLVFAGFSSSHIYIEAASMGLLYWALAMVETKSNRERLVLTVAAMIGAAVTPAYVLGVEFLFHFQRLGLPSFLSQFAAYSAIVESLIETYPWYARQIWDLRLFNPLVPVMALVIVGSLVIIAVRGNRTIGQAPSVQGSRPVTRRLAAALLNRKALLILPFIASLMVAAVYSQPISRASTSHLILGEALVGMLLGYITYSLRAIGMVATAVTVLCVACGTWIVYHTATAGPLQSVLAPWRAVPNHVYLIDEAEVVGGLTREYYSHIGKWLIPGDRYKDINKDLSEFLARLDVEFTGKFKGLPTGRYDEAWVAFDALDVVKVYASTRRFWPVFTEIPQNVITPNTYRKDFKLIMQLFALMKSGALGPADTMKFTKIAWPFALWDQESHYTIGYLGGVRPFLRGTEIESIDLHAIYFVNVAALRRVIAHESLPRR